MRPIDKSLYTLNQAIYNPYGEAKPDLIKAIGKYCSYCEVWSPALDVEHIQNKDNNESKEFEWSNFLLGCKHCNPIKGTKEVNYTQIYMPHRDNTYVIFSYLVGGVIIVNKNLSKDEKKKATNLIELVGLDRDPSHPKHSYKDERWSDRMEIDSLAKQCLKKYTNNDSSIEELVTYAALRGFWSIWMNTFKMYPEVQNRLIEKFNGTKVDYFDSMEVN